MFCFAFNSQTFSTIDINYRNIFSPFKRENNILQEKRPQYLIAVPRLYESLHKSILASFQAQSKVKRSLVRAASAVSASYTHARDVAKGLVVADRQPSVIVKVQKNCVVQFVSTNVTKYCRLKRLWVLYFQYFPRTNCSDNRTYYGDFPLCFSS